jgi:hypothetical protein
METGSRQRWRLIGASMLLGIVFLLALEGVARATAPGTRWLNSYYLEISSDFADLDGLIADNQNWSNAPKYYDEFLYAAAPSASEHVNFTDYYSSRLTPDSVPLGAADHIVWTFGGSTMENTETTDSLTIANTWARIFNDTLGPTHVMNFGTGGFNSSYELIKFQKLLREVPEHELPTIAVFYDGYNDGLFGFQYGPGSLQGDLTLKLKALVEHNHVRGGLYAWSRTLTKYSRLWERTGARLVEPALFPLPDPNTSAIRLDRTVQVYVRNVRMLQSTCEAFQIRCFFVLQPLIVTKQPLTRLERAALDALEAHPRFGVEGTRFVAGFYEQVTLALAENAQFINAASVLDGRQQSDFYDLGHLGAQSPPIVGERIAFLILERLGVMTVD